MLYSGGKDSDVILELARMSGIEYRAIYKNTTIDPPGTIRHCLDNGVDIVRPKRSFAELLASHGLPNMRYRFCCAVLKEYPNSFYNVVLGVRRDESMKRTKRYTEPVVCRVYNKAKGIREQQILPILDWTVEDELSFIRERGIRLHPLYYREDGTLDLSRRLGCMCCPLAYYKKRWAQFERYPRMLRLYLRGAKGFLDSHPDSLTARRYGGAFEWLYADVMYDGYTNFAEREKGGLFHGGHGEDWYRREIEERFGVDLGGDSGLND